MSSRAGKKHKRFTGRKADGEERPATGRGTPKQEIPAGPGRVLVLGHRKSNGQWGYKRMWRVA